ncbi:MAG TPA: hypothetical protein VNJ07_00795 [Chitinophagales bacterium]|nr:hypothetical protein [Chitinophagales bacterium]
MSKIFKIAGVAFLFLLLGGIVTWHYLPTIMAKAIVNECEGLHVIPKKIKHSINQRVDEVPKVLDSLKSEGVYITLDDLIKAIDEAKQEEIIKTIDVLEHAKLQNTDQVIRIVLENMDFGKLENEKLIATAKRKMKMSDVKRAMKMIRENGKPYLLTIPIGKETLKSILLEKKRKIEAELNS